MAKARLVNRKKTAKKKAPKRKKASAASKRDAMWDALEKKTSKRKKTSNPKIGLGKQQVDEITASGTYNLKDPCTCEDIETDRCVVHGTESVPKERSKDECCAAEKVKDIVADRCTVDGTPPVDKPTRTLVQNNKFVAVEYDAASVAAIQQIAEALAHNASACYELAKVFGSSHVSVKHMLQVSGGDKTDVTHNEFIGDSSLRQPVMKEAVREVVACIDDEEHDYSSEMIDCVNDWRREVGEA